MLVAGYDVRCAALALLALPAPVAPPHRRADPRRSSRRPPAQDKGPHLYEFSPSGNTLEYYAMSIGARSQSAKTYLEAHFDAFADCSLDDLVMHGLKALRETLQQDKDLSVLNTSIGIVGAPPQPADGAVGDVGAYGKEPAAVDAFRILEGDALEPYLAQLPPKDDDAAAPRAAASAVAGEAGEAAAPASGAPTADDDAPAPAPGGDASMQTD